MEIDTAIRQRRSVRKFTDDPVPEETVRELLDTARWAPSWANTQSWSVFVVAGEALDELRAAYGRKAEDGTERHFDLPPHGRDWPPHLRARTEQLIAAREAATGTPLAYPPKTSGDFFGAPVVVFFAVDERLEAAYACFDAGLLVQTFCLAAHGRGLGTCIMAMAVAHADVLHGLLPEAEGKRFVVGVALGVPDSAAPLNNFERQRAELDELVSWAR